ncbi:MAG: class I SAM-dependent methyltransferase, partial [Burkholderiaceae bacterium]
MTIDPNSLTFGANAAQYAAARPRYPESLFEWIASLARVRRFAWDAGCGNGQATGALAARFEKIIASDSSAEQIALAPHIANVEWRADAAESTALPAAEVDAAIAANALHWFDLPRFFDLLRDALSENGIFVAFGYGRSVLPAEIEQPVMDAYAALKPYWAEANRALWRGYRDLFFPLTEIE